MKLKIVAIAGTFDRLHKGHRHFISQAFKLGEKVLIGLTSDKFAFSKRESGIKNKESRILKYVDRKKELEKYLKEQGFF